MKKIQLLLTLMLFAGFSMGQQVDRDNVVVEIGSGTW